MTGILISGKMSVDIFSSTRGGREKNEQRHHQECVGARPQRKLSNDPH